MKLTGDQGTYFSLGSLYTNSLLASLNTRQALKSQTDDISLSLSETGTPGRGVSQHAARENWSYIA